MIKHLHNRIILIALLVLPVVFCTSCMKSIVTVNSAKITSVRSLSVVAFNNYPTAPNSGEMMADIFSRYMMKSGYNVVDRIDLEIVFDEKTLALSRRRDKSSIMKMGKLAGVDAVITGTVTIFNTSHREIVLGTVREKIINETKSVNKKTSRLRSDKDNSDNRRRGKHPVLTGGRKDVPHVVTTLAEVGITAKMISVKTGEILWISSYSYEAVNTQVAAEIIASRITRELNKKLTKIEKVSKK